MRTLLLAVALLPCCGTVFAAADRSDIAVAEDIRARFAKSKIAANGFKVEVARGVATISGRTDVVQHKGVATRLAKLGGAKSVVNNIVIGEAARQKAAAKLSSARAATAKSAAKGETQTVSTAPSNAPPAGPGSVPPPVRRAVVKH